MALLVAAMMSVSLSASAENRSNLKSRQSNSPRVVKLRIEDGKGKKQLLFKDARFDKRHFDKRQFDKRRFDKKRFDMRRFDKRRFDKARKVKLHKKQLF